MTATNTPKKTAKYYRDILNSGNISKSLEVLPEIIKKFGSKRWADYSKGNDTIYIRPYTEFNWNHQIERFFIGNYKESKGKILADIYWQGDSTDGNASEYASALAYGKTIPAEHEFIGGRTYYRHGDLRITREEFADALKAVAKYLSPEEIKKRKIAKERSDKQTAVYAEIDSKKKSLDRWEMEGFWNGRYAVQKLLESKPELIDLPLDQLKAIAIKVWEQNNKSDYSLRGGWYSGEKKYNLSY